jgi:hypothetical protein
MQRKSLATSITILAVLMLETGCSKYVDKTTDITRQIIGTWDCTYDSEVGPVHHDRRYTFEPDGQVTRIVYFNNIPLLDHYTWFLEGEALVLHDTKKG